MKLRDGLRPPHHDEAIRVGPPHGLIAELGDLNAAAWAHIPQVRQLAFDRSGQASDDHDVGSLLFEPLDQRMVVKPFVGADDHHPDPGGNFREAGGKEGARPAGGMGIGGPEFAKPEVLALAIETEQGVIRRTASLEGVVPDPRLLLVAVDDKHGGVDIEDEPRGEPRPNRHAGQEAIVQRTQLGEGRRRVVASG